MVTAGGLQASACGWLDRRRLGDARYAASMVPAQVGGRESGPARLR